MAQSNAEIKKIIYASLAKQTLGRALAQLTLLTKGTSNETLATIQENYQRLLTHWAQGSKDPNREVIFNQLLRQTYELTDDLLANRMVKPLAKEETFKRFWEPHRYTDSTLQDAALLRQKGNTQQTAWAASAITLSCLELFDENKLLCLLDFCKSQHPATAMRALTGLMLCLIMYKDRYHLYPSINTKLQILFDNEETATNAQSIIKQLIRSKETEKISQDIRQNILPTITKLAPKLHKEILSDHQEDNPLNTPQEEENDWHEELEKSGVQDKVEAYAHKQRKGYDINYSTFSQMKGYPFFESFENWLLPFDTKHGALKGLLDTSDTSIADNSTSAVTDEVENTNSLGKLLTHTHFLCDSDKYSFCFNLQMIPIDYQKSMIEQIKMGEEQLKDVETPSLQIIANLYLQDLYRFYKLCKEATFFSNPFDMDMDVHKTSFFRLLNPNGVFIKELASFYFEQEQYASALSAFLKAEEYSKPNERTYQKMGYCYQKLEQYEQAIEQYQKAELLNNQEVWTLRKLAYCHRMLQQYPVALTYYTQIDELQPNDVNVIYNRGYCHTQLGNYQEALNAFYKIEFLQGDTNKSIYYHLYMAHCLWATGAHQEAIQHYALFPHDKLAEQLELPDAPLSARDKVYVVDYVRYH